MAGLLGLLAQLIIVSSVTYVTVKTIKFILATRRPKDFPPGPPTVLGLGNLHQLPLDKIFLKFHEWGKTYGDILGVKLGPDNVIVLNRAAHVKELFEKRGAIYSDRITPYVACNMVMKPGEQHLLFLPNDDFLQRWRRAAKLWLGPAGIEASYPFQAAAGAALNKSLLEDPDNFQHHLKRWALTTPMLSLTGVRVDDATLERYFETLETWEHILTPGTTPPLDLAPWLRHLPEYLAPWKRTVRNGSELIHESYWSLLDMARTQIARAEASGKGGSAAGSKEKFEGLLPRLIRNSKKEATPFTDSQLAFFGGAILDASVDTTRSTILTFLLIMALKTEERLRAQAEIDAACEDGRPPEGRDLPKLPYLRACVMETIRLYGPAPVGLPRKSTRDDVYMGYRIPKGSLIFTNMYSIHQQPDEYENPSQFIPDRYLAHPLGTIPGRPQFEGRRASYSFGAGRRNCIGEDLGKNSLILAMARILWAFDLGPVAGEKYDLGVEEMKGFHTLLAFWPNPYKVAFTPRSDEKRKAILEDFRKTQEYLDEALW